MPDEGIARMNLIPRKRYRAFEVRWDGRAEIPTGREARFTLTTDESVGSVYLPDTAADCSWLIEELPRETLDEARG